MSFAPPRTEVATAASAAKCVCVNRVVIAKSLRPRELLTSCGTPFGRA
jgi:hypothetical protein